MSDIATPVLRCEKLGKQFQDAESIITVFDALDLRIAPQEMVAITGASGAGKSTLLHLLGGLDKPTHGTVEIMGNDLSQLSERKRCALRNRTLGFIYQFHHLLPEFNAVENVCFPLWIAGLSKIEAYARAMTLLKEVGLENRATHRVGELSGGERQRVAVARALVNHPACVLADEPTGNLDQETADVVFALMQKLNQTYRTSFVVVTHNEVLARRCHRVLRLSGGKLL